jgi:hypothetical protein
MVFFIIYAQVVTYSSLLCVESDTASGCEQIKRNDQPVMMSSTGHHRRQGNLVSTVDIASVGASVTFTVVLVAIQHLSQDLSCCILVCALTLRIRYHKSRLGAYVIGCTVAVSIMEQVIDSELC